MLPFSVPSGLKNNVADSLGEERSPSTQTPCEVTASTCFWTFSGAPGMVRSSLPTCNGAGVTGFQAPALRR